MRTFQAPCVYESELEIFENSLSSGISTFPFLLNLGTKGHFRDVTASIRPHHVEAHVLLDKTILERKIGFLVVIKLEVKLGFRNEHIVQSDYIFRV